MSTITSLKLGTVPITEEGVDRYKFSDPITNHFTQIAEFTENLNSSVGRVFSKTKIPVSWITVMNANYLIATMEFNNPSGSSLNVKAWIDSIDILSDSEDYPQVEVRWHFDYYEMFKSSATLGYGHVKRRPFNDLDSTPIQNYPKRYEHIGSYSQAIINMLEKNSRTVWWVLVSVNVSSHIRMYTYPVMLDADSSSIVAAYFWIRDMDDSYNNKKASGPAVRSIYNGQMDELLANILGTAPESVNGIWVCPFSPYIDEGSITGSGTFDDPFVFATPYPIEKWDAQHSVLQIPYNTTPLDIYREVTFTKIKSSEEHRYILTSSDGVKILELPYGFEVEKVRTTLILEPDGPYLEISFKDLSYGNLEGLAVNIPLLSFPMNSNAYTSYVYSGRQEYDRNMRTLRSNADAIKSISAGAGTGAIFGSIGPAGALLGALGGSTGGVGNYFTETFYQNDREQELENRLQANQPSTMILSSNMLLSYIRGYGFNIKDIVPDSYSSTQISNTRSNFGISVDEILSSCETMVKTTLPTGYYSIKNLIISGSIPKEAKDYIKRKFDAGVRLL
ncbi:MAG: hypothetical protein IKY66_01670 [Bacteroidales bacterium]|nr:hypothetical protein [Bacteroidales bacterium]